MGLVNWSLIFSPLLETGSPGVAEGPPRETVPPFAHGAEVGSGVGEPPPCSQLQVPQMGVRVGLPLRATVLPADGWLRSLGPFEALVPWKSHAYVVTLNQQTRNNHCQHFLSIYEAESTSKHRCWQCLTLPFVTSATQTPWRVRVHSPQAVWL